MKIEMVTFGKFFTRVCSSSFLLIRDRFRLVLAPPCLVAVKTALYGSMIRDSLVSKRSTAIKAVRNCVRECEVFLINFVDF